MEREGRRARPKKEHICRREEAADMRRFCGSFLSSFLHLSSIAYQFNRPQQLRLDHVNQALK